MGTALGLAQVAALAGRFYEKAAQRCGIAYIAGEGFGAELADKAVRVMLGWQKQKLDGASVRGQGQGGIERRAARRPPSPSKLKTTASVKRNSFCTCSGVQAVPSVATALAKPSCASATTSI